MREVTGPPSGRSGPTYGAHALLDTTIGLAGDAGDARSPSVTMSTAAPTTATSATVGHQARADARKAERRRALDGTEICTSSVGRNGPRHAIGARHQAIRDTLAHPRPTRPGALSVAEARP